MTTSGLVTKMLGLEPNARLAQLMPSRLEYGVEADLAVSFEISNPLGGFHAATEEKFASHPGKRNIGIFGTGDPIEALRLLLKAYPDATVLMRLHGKPRKRRKK